MDQMVERIREPELCYIFARNARRKGHPELAEQAIRHAVDLRAESHEPASDAERAALRSIYAYEEALSEVKGRRARATGTWQLVRRHGVFEAVERRLKGNALAEVEPHLEALKLEDYGFAAVMRSYPEYFGGAAA